ncbi:helix-turn-helix domain-containing protein [Bittarella massiliensis (ex Durand et al. 2017)]|uniref:helix-turn-helix domain-containing protein n=1 Tax=Bittarella massiliensis (ex Durand et al. 2017) TaxID=1720313 RepID=UPI001AA0D568|nr:helix-turn-helix transcriptional regulator [Bittarella massiliensis (ex Durand et al. 2017)]
MVAVKLGLVLARQKMTLTQLSQEVGVTAVNLSALKTGKAKGVRFSTLDKICRALDCQLGDLLEWRPDPQP